MQKGLVIWFTGLPNAGKTTISKLLEKELKLKGYDVERIDSDEVPRSLTKELSSDWFIRQKQKSTNIIYVAKLLYKHRIIVLISSVGRLRKMRETARNEIDDFVEIYLRCSLNTRLERDQLAKYSRYPSTIHYYEEPNHPEMIIDTDQLSPNDAVQQILDYLSSQGMIAGAKVDEYT